MAGFDGLPQIPRLGRVAGAARPAAARSSLSAAVRSVGGPLAAAASLAIGALSLSTPRAPIEAEPAPVAADERVTDAPASIPAASPISPSAAAAGSQSTATGGSASLPEDGSALRRLQVLQADTAPAPRLDRVEQAAHVEARQWDGAAAADGARSEPRPVVDGGGLARLPGDGPQEAGPVGDLATTSPYVAPEVGPEKNVTPYQGLIDAATKLMSVAGILLLASSVLVFIGKKLLKSLVTHAAGVAMIAAGMAMAYAALGMAVAVTALGVAILAHGQKLQGLIFTMSGAALTFAAYKAANGDRKAYKEATRKQTEAAQAQGTPARQATAEKRVPTRDLKPETTRVQGEPQQITVDGGQAPKVETVPSPMSTELQPREWVDSKITYGDIVSEPGSAPASVPAGPTQAGGSYRLGGRDVDPGLRNYADPSLSKRWQTPHMDQWDGDILQAAKEKGVPANLIQGVIEHESRGNPLAVNPQSGAQGLGQMLKAFRQDHGVANAFDGKQAIDRVAGALKKVYLQTGSWDKALAAYARGPAGMAKGLGFDYAATINGLVRTVPAK